jgi:hypothetical protein
MLSHPRALNNSLIAPTDWTAIPFPAIIDARKRDDDRLLHDGGGGS